MLVVAEIACDIHKWYTKNVLDNATTLNYLVQKVSLKASTYFHRSSGGALPSHKLSCHL